MILVTGAAGFTGYHIVQRLLRDGHAVVGLDNISGYYDPSLKESRLRQLGAQKRFTFHRADIVDQADVADLFSTHSFNSVIHLAAQADVRHSLTSPRSYVDSNIIGFLNILEGCRHCNVGHLVFASSSSVYGLNTHLPFSTHHPVDHPVSLYGATKKANELMAHSYNHLFGLPTTGLRFFTVYGPWSRPDMAYFVFTKSILEGQPIDVYNKGKMKRDFTYIDDIVESVVRVIACPAKANADWRSEAPDSASSSAPYRLYNIGQHSSIELLHFMEIIEKSLGKKAVVRALPAQRGDVIFTTADDTDLSREFAFTPNTTIQVGIRRFLDWCREYFGAQDAARSSPDVHTTLRPA